MPRSGGPPATAAFAVAGVNPMVTATRNFRLAEWNTRRASSLGSRLISSRFRLLRFTADCHDRNLNQIIGRLVIPHTAARRWNIAVECRKCLFICSQLADVSQSAKRATLSSARPGALPFRPLSAKGGVVSLIVGCPGVGPAKHSVETCPAVQSSGAAIAKRLFRLWADLGVVPPSHPESNTLCRHL